MAIGIAFVLVVIFLVVHKGQLKDPHSHVFFLSTNAPYLKEDVALSMATEAIKQDGLDPAVWKPNPDGRTTSPDGVRDDYMARNGGNPNRGEIQFVNKAVHDSRLVTISLISNQVICVVSTGF